MRTLLYVALTIAICWFANYAAHAAELNIPATVPAGNAVSIETAQQNGEFILVGPGHVLRTEVRAGDSVEIPAKDLRVAGRYLALLKNGSGWDSKTFFVQPAKPNAITFLARPSRVPTARQGVVTGVAFVFDDYKNLVLAPAPVKFDLAVEGEKPQDHTVQAKQGIAWVQMDSGRKQGAAQFIASLTSAETSDSSVRRVVQQVAADACDIKMTASRTDKAIVVSTEPIKDCSGNPVPDGTIVTFTETDSSGRSTIDARVKKDIAQAELPLSPSATISVASGVVLGNELHIGAGEGK